MILRSIFEDYKKIFILCLEVAGEKTGNKLLLNVEKYLDEDLIFSIIDELEKHREVRMGEIICIMLSTILVPKAFGISKIHEGLNDIPDISDIPKLQSKIEQVSNEAADIYFKYLKTASEKFCSSKGIDLVVDFKYMNKSGLIK
jgi:hypothetical protein